MLSYALYAYGYAFRDADPVRALEALRRGLVIAQDSGNRFIESLAGDRFVSARGRTRRPAGGARSHHSGHPQLLRLWQRRLHPFPPGNSRGTPRPPRTPRTGSHHRRFRIQSLDRGAVPEINTAIAHLRDVLGDQTYESLARKGETMTTAEMATYAYDQIDQARAELNAVSNRWFMRLRRPTRDWVRFHAQRPLMLS